MENLRVDDEDDRRALAQSFEGAALITRVYAQSLSNYFRRCCRVVVDRVNEACKVNDLVVMKGSDVPCLDFDDRVESKVRGKRLDLTFGPVKGLKRVLAKAVEKQREMDDGAIASDTKDGRVLTGLDYVLDWLRATVCAQDPYALVVFFEVLRQSEDMFRVQRVKNKFFDWRYEENIRTNVLINLLLLYPRTRADFVGSGLMTGETWDHELAGKPLMSCEIQLTLNDYLTIKQLMHTYYEFQRSAAGAKNLLQHPIFLTDDTLEEKIPPVMRKINERERAIRRVAQSFIHNLKTRLDRKRGKD